MEMKTAIQIINKIGKSKINITPFDNAFIQSIKSNSMDHEFISDKQAAFLCKVAIKHKINTTKIKTSKPKEGLFKRMKGWGTTKARGRTR